MKTADMVAFAGEVSLEKAVWDTDWGMYVVLQIDQKPQEKDHANPFKRFTKMRKGRVGTRFDAVFAVDKDEALDYEDEVMLKGWSDSTSGWKVTLWVNANEQGLHPFMKHEKGQKYSLVCVELDDDNEVINQTKRERLTRADARRQHPLAMFAGQLANSEDFQEYLSERTGHEFGSESAAQWIREACNVESRRDLDVDQEAASRFHQLVRIPYLRWNEQRIGV